MSSQKQIHENWSKFLKEYTPSTTLPGLKQKRGPTSNEPEPEEDPRVMGPDKQADAPAALAWWKTLPEPQKSDLQKAGEAAMIIAWREAGKPEAGGEEAAEEPSKVIAGINSLSYPDSLLNMLRNVDLSGPQKRQLLNLMLQATEQDDIVLEAIGDAQRDPRTFSPKTSKRLNDLIGSFNLKPKAKNNLEKVLNKWAKMNTVKFSKAAMDDEDTADEPTVTGRAVSPVRSQAAAADSRYAGKGWDPYGGPEQKGEWIENPTDEVALKAIIQNLGDWRANRGTYKKARKQLEFLEDLVERGGGLFIEDGETGDKNVTPKWAPHEDPDYAGGYQIQPQLFYFDLSAPASMANFFKQAVANVPAFLTNRKTAGMKLSKNISPRNQQYLKMFVKEFKKGFESRRKPEDPKNLEESFDRLQTLAGINKRIL